jgi:MraZ protein
VTGFLGQYQATLDEKGRILLPSKLRSVKGLSKKPLLDGDIILTKGLEGCLSVYPESEFEAIQNKLSSLDFTQRDFRFFSRRFYSAAAVVTPDKTGRILVPSHLISEAGFQKELLIIGVNRWIEVWNPDRYQYYLEQYSGSYEEVADRLFSGHDQEKE